MSAFAISGLAALGAGAGGILLATGRTASRGRRILATGAVAALVSAVLAALGFGAYAVLFSGGLVLDAYSSLVAVTVMVCGAAVLVLSMDSHELGEEHIAEYASLVLLAVLGGALMAATKDFAAFFVALQLSSIPLYVLAGFAVDDRMATEAAFKFMLLGMVVTAIMLYGFSIAFLQTASTSFSALGQQAPAVPAAAAAVPATVVAVIFILAGFSFKAGAAPFHFWIPDAYQGAPTPVTALLATVPKLAAIAALLRLVAGPLSAPGLEWTRWLLAAIAVLSMTLGNILAYTQTDLKRLLAYSSVAQIGYILAAPAAAGEAAGAATLFYAVVYALTNIGAFAVVVAVSGGRKHYKVDDLAGMWQRSPLAAVALAFFVLSMLGLPPTPGFWAKLGVISTTVGSGAAWLGVLIVLNTLLSVGYYVRVLRQLFIAAPVEAEIRPPASATGVVACAFAAAAFVGLWPTGLQWLSRVAAQAGLGA